MKQIKENLVTELGTSILPLDQISEEAKATLIAFFSSNWLREEIPSFEKHLGLTILSHLAYLGNFIAERPETWEPVKEFLFDIPLDYTHNLMISDCLWVLSNVCGDYSRLRMELARSEELRRIIDDRMSYAKKDLHSSVDMVSAITTACQSLIRSEESLNLADPATVEYFAKIALDILRSLSFYLLEHGIENIFVTLKFYVRCARLNAMRTDFLCQEFFSGNMEKVFLDFVYTKSSLIRNEVLEFMKELSLSDQTAIPIATNGVFSMFHSLLRSLLLSDKEQAGVLLICSNLCTTGYKAVKKLCNQPGFVADILTWASDRQKIPAIVKECYFVICNAASNADPEELEFMFNEMAPGTLVYALTKDISLPAPSDIFRA